MSAVRICRSGIDTPIRVTFSAAIEPASVIATTFSIRARMDCGNGCTEAVAAMTPSTPLAYTTRSTATLTTAGAGGTAGPTANPGRHGAGGLAFGGMVGTESVLSAGAAGDTATVGWGGSAGTGGGDAFGILVLASPGPITRNQTRITTGRGGDGGAGGQGGQGADSTGLTGPGGAAGTTTHHPGANASQTGERANIKVVP